MTFKKLLTLAAAILCAGSMWAYQTPEDNGIYYVYNTGVTDGGSGFISRGEDYGQRAVISPYGLPVKLISTGAEDTYYFQFIDHKGYLCDDGFMYTDAGIESAEESKRRAIKVELQSDGIYKLLNTDNGKEVENWYGYPVGDGTGNRRDYLWQFLSIAEYEAMISGYTTTQNLAIVNSMGLPSSITTTEAFKNYLSENYVEIDNTPLIQHATFDTGHSTEGWTITGQRYRACTIGWGNEGGDKITPEVYQGCGTISQTVTVSKAGLYKVSVNAFYRGANYADVHNAGASGSVAFLQVNSNKERIGDIYYSLDNTTLPSGPNNANTNFFAKGKYLTEVYVYVTEENKNVTITLNQPAYGGGCWFVFNNFSLVYYTNEVTLDDANALIDKFPSTKVSDNVADKVNTAKSTLLGNLTLTNYRALEALLPEAQTSAESYQTIENGIPNNSLTGWTISNSSTFHVNTWSNEGASDGSNFGTPFIENWRDSKDKAPLADATMTYTLEGLNPGTYKVSARIRALNEYNGSATISGAYLWATGASDVDATANSDACTNGIVGNYSINASVGDDGVLSFGIKNVSATYNWVSFKNFAISDLTDITTASETLLASVPSGKMNATVEANLNTAVANLESDKNNVSYYDALSDAIMAANTSIDCYASAKVGIDKLNDLLAKSNVYTTEAYSTIYASVTAYENGTMTDAEASTLNATIFGTGAYNGENTIKNLLLSAWDEGWTINTWSIEGNNDGSNFKTPFYQYWAADNTSLGSKTFTATVTGLTANQIVEVSAWTRVRQRDQTDAEKKASTDVTKIANGVTMQVGESDAVDVSIGSKVGSSQFYLDTFTARGAVDASGNLTIKFIVAENSNISWLSVKDIKYTVVGEAASAEELAALNAAITKVESYTLGFEVGEYAPYNLAVPLTNAKAISSSSLNGKAEVSEAIAALNAVTANATEVNAIDLMSSYNASNVDASNRLYAAGWGKGGATDATNTRLMKGTENAGMAAVDDEIALFTKFGTTYGEETGYTMPLKANTVYKLTFKYGAWGENKDIVSNLAITDGNGANIAITPASFTYVKNSGLANVSTEAWFDYTGMFTTGDAGNYVITLTKNNNAEQRQIVMGNIELKKVPETNVTLAVKAGKYGTFIAPFDVTIPAGVEASTVTGVEGTTLTMATVSTTIPANTPVILYNTTAEDISKEVAGQSIATADTYTEGLLTGVVNGSQVIKEGYVLQTLDGKQAFYLVSSSDPITIPANKCYLTVPAGIKERALYFDGDATAISGINTEGAAVNGAVYNVNGQQLNGLQRGINIVNGKKVLVK